MWLSGVNNMVAYKDLKSLTGLQWYHKLFNKVNCSHGTYIRLSAEVPSTLPHLPGTGLPVVASPLPPPTGSRAGGN